MLLRHRPPALGSQPVTTAKGFEHLDEGRRGAPLASGQPRRVRARRPCRRGDPRQPQDTAGPVAIVPAPYGRNLERLSRALWSAHARLRIDGGRTDRTRAGEDDRGEAGARAALDAPLRRSRPRHRGPSDGARRYQELLYEAGRVRARAGPERRGRLAGGPRALRLPRAHRYRARDPRSPAPAARARASPSRSGGWRLRASASLECMPQARQDGAPRRGRARRAAGCSRGSPRSTSACSSTPISAILRGFTDLRPSRRMSARSRAASPRSATRSRTSTSARCRCWSRSREDGCRVALAIVAILLGANVTTQLLKPLLAHPRATRSARRHRRSSPASWPSGHATAAMSLALCVVLAAPGAAAPARRGARARVRGRRQLLVPDARRGTTRATCFGGFLVAGIWTLLAVAAVFDAANARRPQVAASELARPA